MIKDKITVFPNDSGIMYGVRFEQGKIHLNDYSNENPCSFTKDETKLLYNTMKKYYENP